MGTAYVRPNTPLPSAWANATTAGIDVTDNWWSSFGDPQLLALMKQAVKSNLDLHLAIDRILVAKDMVKVANSLKYPTVVFGALPTDPITSQLSTLKNTGTVDVDQNLFEFALDASYTLDFWGRIKNTVSASHADYQASEYDAGIVQINLHSEVARSYFDIREYDEETLIEKQRENLANEHLQLEQIKLNAGRIDATPVVEAQQAIYKIQDRLSELSRERAVAVENIAVLMGEIPESLTIDSAPLRTTIVAMQPPEGLPSSLLSRRPDLRAAESHLMAAHAQLAVARAELLPDISLTAKFGYVAGAVQNLVRSGSTVSGIGPQINYPVYDAGRGKAKLDASRRQRDAALTEYRKSILEALADVEKTLLNYQATVESGERIRRIYELQQDQVNRVESLIATGRATRFESLLARERALDFDVDALHNFRARLDCLIGMYQAMGGGWNLTDLPLANNDSDKPAAPSSSVSSTLGAPRQ